MGAEEAMMSCPCVVDAFSEKREFLIAGIIVEIIDHQIKDLEGLTEDE
jgi:hypothetical protein